jgi:hypothetical protein
MDTTTSRARIGRWLDRYDTHTYVEDSIDVNQSNAPVEEARSRHHLEEASVRRAAAPGLRLQLSCTQQDHGWSSTQ